MSRRMIVSFELPPTYLRPGLLADEQETSDIALTVEMKLGARNATVWDEDDFIADVADRAIGNAEQALHYVLNQAREA